jgi:hypothetical protein
MGEYSCLYSPSSELLCGLYYDAVVNSVHTAASNDRFIENVNCGSCNREQPWPILR